MKRNSINEPPVFDGENYPEWKIKMEHFIKANFGIEAWRLIINGWSSPTLDDGKGRKIEKPFENWTEFEIKTCKLNSRALDAIFYSIGQQHFRCIAFCETAKEAWETLQTVYEKTGKLQEQALLSLEKRFRNIKMDNYETLSSYYERLVDITYEAKTLGHTYSNFELVSKVLRSLPDRFAPKVDSISSKGKLMSLSFVDLIGTLKAYEKKLELRAKVEAF